MSGKREISILFWNMKKKGLETLNNLLSALEKAGKKPMIIALAECPLDLTTITPYQEISLGNKKVRVFIKQGDFSLSFHSNIEWLGKLNIDDNRYFELIDKFSLCELSVNVNKEIKTRDSILLFFVHLHDKIWHNELQQYLYASYLSDLFYRIEQFKYTKIKAEIEAEESINTYEFKIQNRTSLIMGDFNMNPFELGMTARECFNSYISYREIIRESGNLPDDIGRRYYNPTWQMIGDELTQKRTPYKTKKDETIKQILSITQNESDHKTNLIKERYGTYNHKTQDVMLDMVLMKVEGYKNYFRSIEIIDTKLSDHLPILLNLAVN